MNKDFMNGMKRKDLYQNNIVNLINNYYSENKWLTASSIEEVSKQKKKKKKKEYFSKFKIYKKDIL